MGTKAEIPDDRVAIYTACMDAHRPVPGLDPAIIRELSALEQVQPGILTTLATTYLEQASQLVRELTSAHDHAHEAIRHTAHKLKGSSASLGARELADLCYTIETKARSGEPSTGDRARLPEMLATIRPAIEALS